jgi:hypothetical protein
MSLPTYSLMKSVGSYIQWAQLAGLDLKFPVTEYTLNYTAAMSDANLYTVSYGVEDLWRISGYSFLQKALSICFALSGNAPIMPHRGFLASGEELPKYMHYAGHAETLSEIFESLDITRVGRSFPSSAIIFEFLEGATAIDFPTVRLRFYDGEKQVYEILKLPGQQSETLPLLKFSEYLTERIKNAGGPNLVVKDKCTQVNDINPSPKDFYPGALVI